MGPDVDLSGSLRARATLTRGTAFLSAVSGRAGADDPWPEGPARRVRERFAANCLAELERFLHVLMDEVHLARTGTSIARWHNAALKLGSIGADRSQWGEQQHRLRALARSRVSLRHLSGVARRPDRPGERWMTAGWVDPEIAGLQRYHLGDRLEPSGAHLIEICGFYNSTASKILDVARTDR